MERIFVWSDGLILLDSRTPLSSGDTHSASTSIIIPGERIGHIRLGMSESQVKSILGTPGRRTEFEGTTVEHEMQMIAFLNEQLGRNDTVEDFPPQPPCVFVDFEEQGSGRARRPEAQAERNVGRPRATDQSRLRQSTACETYKQIEDLPDGTAVRVMIRKEPAL